MGWFWRAALASDRRLAHLMSSYWTNFIKRGDPNGPGLPAWPTFTAQQQRALRLDDPATAGAFPLNRGLEVMDRGYDQVRGAPVGAAATSVPAK